MDLAMQFFENTDFRRRKNVFHPTRLSADLITAAPISAFFS